MLPPVSGSQEGTGVKILPRKFDNLLGFDPATVHKLEALQVDNLKSRALGCNLSLKKMQDTLLLLHRTIPPNSLTHSKKTACD